MDLNVSHVTTTQAYIRGDQSGGQEGRFTAQSGGYDLVRRAAQHMQLAGAEVYQLFNITQDPTCHVG